MTAFPITRRIAGAAALAAALLFAPAAQALTPLEEANKAVVLAFYEAAINRKDADAALALVGPVYIQHNPRAPDGIDGLKGFLGFLKQTYPEGRGHIKRVVVQGDLVVLHVHSVPRPGELGSAIVDIFRVDNGKIVEHWDVIQPVPEKAANNNTMF